MQEQSGPLAAGADGSRVQTGRCSHGRVGGGLLEERRRLGRGTGTEGGLPAPHAEARLSGVLVKGPRTVQCLHVQPTGDSDRGLEGCRDGELCATGGPSLLPREAGVQSNLSPGAMFGEGSLSTGASENS